jgi:hypothetical protein
LRDQAVTMPLDSLVVAALGRVILGLMPGDILIVQADRGGVDFQGFLAPQRG